MKPICPSCNTKMLAKYFVGYYEQFSCWSCECKIIPGSVVEAGSFSFAESGTSVEEYLGVLENDQ